MNKTKNKGKKDTYCGGNKVEIIPRKKPAAGNKNKGKKQVISYAKLEN